MNILSLFKQSGSQQPVNTTETTISINPSIWVIFALILFGIIAAVLIYAFKSTDNSDKDENKEENDKNNKLK